MGAEVERLIREAQTQKKPEQVMVGINDLQLVVVTASNIVTGRPNVTASEAVAMAVGLIAEAVVAVQHDAINKAISAAKIREREDSNGGRS